MKYYTLAAVLLLCGIGLTTSCSVADSPVVPSAEEREAQSNRDELVSHLENDSKTLAAIFKTESLNITSQAYEQLLSLMQRNKGFLTNMRVILSAVSERKALLSIRPVAAGSELAKMGYLLYMTAENSGFGVRVVFDGKGNCRLLSAQNMEFIFPADIQGVGTTLFKVTIKDSDENYQSVIAADILNMKRVAFINRFPQLFTMTLTGLINSKEVTLSETVISLQLPQDEQSDYVSFDAKSFRLSGQQRNMTGNESTLDFSLQMNQGETTFSYGYASEGASVVNCESQLQFAQSDGFLSQMKEHAFRIADLKAVSIRILDDLTLTGTISDGSSFAQVFSAAIKNRQQASSPDDLAAVAHSLNQSSSFLLSCHQMTKPDVLKFCVTQKDNQYTIEPALKDLRSGDFIPVSQIVDVQTMDNFNLPFSQSFTPGGNAAGSALNFYSVFLQMMPLAK